MIMQRLAGSWVGTYTYVEPEVPGPQIIGFRLRFLDARWWRLTGEVSDDPDVGMEGQGIISGWSWGRHVWFRKMCALYVAQDPKPIPLAEYVQKDYSERLEREPSPHVVSYRGVIAPNGASITGTWSFPHRRLVLPSKRLIVFPAAHGTWKMQRK
jgi:hypothetical protein